MSLRTVRVTRYVTPLREGGSLPAIVEADDDGLYVLKFRGAGQGIRALIAELVAGEIGRALDLPIPELVFAEVDADLARTEPDPEIFALVRASAGLNLALDYLPSAVAFDPMIETLDPILASRIVWFDAYVTNVDRTVRNTNLLMWHRRPWLIDHGAALYVHHSPGWESQPERARAPFPGIRQHVLLPKARALAEVDADMASRLSPARIHEVVGLIPGEWLGALDATTEERDHLRQAYERYLVDRLTAPRLFVSEAIGAR
jgi:hypothetical protein